MKGWIVRGILAVAVLAAGVIIWILSRAQAPVTVSVVNSSQKGIAWVQLTHEQGTEILSNLPAGQSRVVRFRTRGETAYTLRVRFEDGTEIEGGGNYAEPGYSFTESITGSTVTSELGGMQY